MVVPSEKGMLMSQPEPVEVLVLGSGFGGKLLAWQMAQSGRRTTVLDRRWVGDSCPNIACLPSKNEIWSARIAYFVRHASEFGTVTGPATTEGESSPPQARHGRRRGRTAFAEL
jgi:pyruvate/2-oxoglutarate dehydrogenase complex dihydrolipoamide dehydrogenase (E3) component